MSLFPPWLTNRLANVLVPRGILTSRLDVTRLDIAIPHLPDDLIGFTIAHVSDLHVGKASHWIPALAEEAASEIAAAQPGVIVNTGDFVWRDAPLERARLYASKLTIERRDALPCPAHLAVLGNHDHYLPAESTRLLAEGLELSGIRVLTNTATCVRHGRDGVSFVGLTDEEEGFEQGVEALLAAGRPRVALVHAPDLAERLPRGSADLVLCGHTHGGQITLPYLEKWIVRKGCSSDYVSGMYRINGMPVYVNRGLGYTGLPIRFRSRPEVTIFRLTD